MDENSTEEPDGEGKVDVDAELLGTLVEVLDAPPIAAVLKAANLFPGFIANTIPCWQWFAWRQ